MASARPLVALAYSGGLDTSYCILWLRERGYDVLAVTVDTGGFAPGAATRTGPSPWRAFRSPTPAPTSGRTKVSATSTPGPCRLAMIGFKAR